MKLRLTIDVEYRPNGEGAEYLGYLLRHLANYAAGNGFFTGESAAEVVHWSAGTEEIASYEPYQEVE